MVVLSWMEMVRDPGKRIRSSENMGDAGGAPAFGTVGFSSFSLIVWMDLT